MNTCNLRALAGLLFWLLVTPIHAAAAAISYHATHVTGPQWQLDYQITADVVEPAIQEFSIYFDLSRYRNLVVVATPAGWDSLVLAPDPGLPADGLLDALALGAGLVPGSAVGGFSVMVDFSGAGAPGTQLFEIVDPASFAVISSGLTVPQAVVAVAEPQTLALLLGGMLVLWAGSARPPLRARWLLAVLPWYLSACGGASDTVSADVRTPKLLAASSVTTSAAVPQVVVSGIQKVSELRTGRSEFEYSFRINVINQGTLAYSSVVATLTAVGAGSTIVQGRVTVGALAAGASVTPAGLITLRQDRTQAFDVAALVWQVTAEDTLPAVPGILIPGDPAATAVSQLPDFIADQSAAQLTTAEDVSDGMRYYMRQLHAAIAVHATASQVNAALAAQGARIVYAQQNVPTIVLAVPAASSAAALSALAQRLQDSGAFDAVGLVSIPVAMGLPPNVSPAVALEPHGPIVHQIAAHAVPVWPGTGAPLPALKEVVVIIVDYFGAGTSPRFIKEVGSTLRAEEFNQLSPNQHGYHVLGIVAGGFGGEADAFGRVSGLLPAAVDLHVVDLQPQVAGHDSYPLRQNGKIVQVGWLEFLEHRLRQIIRDQPAKRYVINFSIGYCRSVCSRPLPAQRESDAIHWRTYIRSLRTVIERPEAQILLVSAAGNGQHQAASIASFFNGGVLLPTLQSAAPSRAQLPPLSNGLVVENRVVLTPAGQRPVPGCLAGGSNVGGNIGAIGEQVFSYTGPASTGVMNGTSMAAPQVAGLAAWMWGTRPDLDAADLIAILQARAYTPEGLSKDPCAAAPMIDAMAAMQALDRVAAGSAAVRLRQLQPERLTPQAVFGVDDAEQFLKGIFPAVDAEASSGTDAYSAYDLNGDGHVADLSRARYDLKFNQPPVDAAVFEVLTTYPDGGATRIDENRATDFEVLCYYVNSDLFRAGDRAAFDARLQAIAIRLGHPVSCGAVDQVELRVDTGAPNWQGLPATLQLSSFAVSDIARFIRDGSPGNTCGGERGAPSFSATVDSAARFLAVSVVQNMPSTTGGPAINRRPCSSFYAARSYGAGLPDQVWINATGRGQRFVDTLVTDWEYQIRYTNGDPRLPLPGANKRCEVGVVPGSGVFSKHFDAVCSHRLTSSGVVQ